MKSGKRQTQLNFDRLWAKRFKRSIVYGGSDQKGSRKNRRPLDQRYPVHLVLRSSLARGERSFLKGSNGRFISNELKRFAERYRLKLIEWENVGNHLHLVLRFRDPKDIGKFLKVFCARISMRMLDTKKGNSTEDVLRRDDRRFWDATPFSRVVFERLKEGFGLLVYLRKNGYERMGWDKKTAELWARELPSDIVFGPPDGFGAVTWR